jgi:hypothetical protein
MGETVGPMESKGYGIGQVADSGTVLGIGRWERIEICARGARCHRCFPSLLTRVIGFLRLFN